MLYFAKAMHMRYLVNDTWSRLDPSWYFYAHTVSARTKAKKTFVLVH